MATVIGGWKRLALASLAATLVPVLWVSVRAQPPGGGANLPGVAQGAVSLPPLPPSGAWGEVIMADKNWLVVQNHEGQQFPIQARAINQFLIRWPIARNAITPNSVIEAIGQDLGSNTLQTEHADVFEGADRDLVRPTYASLLPNNRLVTTIDPGFNRFMNAFDVGSQNMQHGWAYPVNPGQLGIPAQLHVVGNAVSTDPVLRVSVLNTNFANVLPPPGNDLTLTQVTQGSTSFAEKGDVVFLMPTELTTRTVVLSQLVLYKRIPLRQFRLR